ncbi:MAG: hypothetical protein ACM3SW_13320 [Actinomycetota bacterium]
MLDRLRKIVLLLIGVMTLLSPFMQLDSWDAFPRSTDDLELQLIFALCLVGMFLVFVGVAQLLPEAIHAILRGRAVAAHLSDCEPSTPAIALSLLSPPLRI